MKGRFASAAIVAIALLFGATSVARADQGGNSAAAHACQQDGYLSLVGSDGTTFDTVGACVSYAAHGRTFAEGIIIPAGHVATLADAHWSMGPCDALTYGYQLNTGPLVPLASKPYNCFLPPSVPVDGATIGPVQTATLLRIFLTDTGTGTSCNYTFFSDGPHALVIGANPYTVDIRDSFFCTSGPTEPLAPTGPGGGNISLVVTIT